MANDNIAADYLKGREAATAEDNTRLLESIVGGGGGTQQPATINEGVKASAEQIAKGEQQVAAEERGKQPTVVGGIATQAVGGVRDAVVQGGKAVEDLTQWLREHTPLGELPVGPKLQVKLPNVREPKGMVEQVTRSAAQFLTGFVPFFKATKAAGLGTGAAGAVAGAATDFSVFDPTEPRISNLINQLAPALRTPLTDYLEAKPGDSGAEARFKQTVEGLALGGMTEGLLRAAKVLKAARGAGKEALEASKPALASERGAIKPKPAFEETLYHGSPQRDLTEISVNPASRQFDNATSQFGAFFTPDKQEAARYAGKTGGVYETRVGLHRPYEMTWGEFGKFQNIQKAADGSPLPTSQWGQRAEELKVEAAARRKELEAQGYDGIIVRDSKGNIKEVASFGPVQLPGAPGAEAGAGFKPRPVVEVKRVTEGEARDFLSLNPDAIQVGDRVLKVGWEQLGDQAQLSEVIDRTTKVFRDRVEVARRGKISDENLRLLARELDMPVESFLGRRVGAALNAEQSLAMVSLLGGSAKRLRGLAEQVAGGNLEARQAMLDQLSLHAALQEQAFGARAEAGRALRVWGMNADGTIAHSAKLAQVAEGLTGQAGSGLDAERLAQMVIQLDSPAKLAKMTREATQPGWIDMAQEYWINALLSNPTTHVANFLSNALTAMWAIPERGLAAQLSTKGQGVVSGEATQMIFGLVGGTWDALKLAGKAMKEGAPVREGSKVEGYTRKAISGTNLGVSGPMGTAIDLLGTTVRSPGRFLMASDEFFKEINFRMELNAQALRQASSEGLTTRKAISTRTAELLQDPDFLKRVKPLADEFADYQTFTKPLGEAGQAIQNWRDAHPAFKLVVPFLRTPVNIFKYVGERTPFLNRLSTEVRADLAAGGARAQMAQAKVQLGGMVMASTAVLASSGYITGKGPTDSNLRREWLESHQPYSVKIGGQWYAYNRLDPIGATMGMAADFADIVGHLDEIDAAQLAAAAGLSVSNNMLSKTYLTGLSDVLEAIQNPAEDAAKTVKKMLGTVVPAGVAQVARMTDPTMREVNGLFDGVIARVPGWSSTLPPRLNLWGEPVLYRGSLGPDLASPIYTKSADIQPVSNELEQQGVSISMPGKYVFGKTPAQVDPLAQPSAKDGVPLTDKEYEQYVKLAAGQGLGNLPLLKDKLAAVIQSPAYQNLSDGPDGSKALRLRTEIYAYRAAAQQKLIATHPDLQQAIITKLKNQGEALRPKNAGMPAVLQPRSQGESTVQDLLKNLPSTLSR